MLRRVVYMSRSIGTTGLSTVSLAHVLGASERNNRRDEITSGLVVHADRILQALEGPAEAVERAAKAEDLPSVRRLHGMFSQEVRRVAEQAGVDVA